MPTPILLGGEVGCYYPSYDDAVLDESLTPIRGNGTNTLTDFGSFASNGTLTDMDAASDWVANTAHDGVRALDQAGGNDRIITGVPYSLGTSDFWLSMWLYIRNGGLNDDWFSNRTTGAAGTAAGFVIGKSGIGGVRELIVNFDDGAGAVRRDNYFAFYELDTWFHLCVVWVNSTGLISVYRNGSLVIPSGTVLTGTIAGKSIGSSGNAVISGRPGITSGRSMDGLWDAARMYYRTPTAEEIAFLASSRMPGGLLLAKKRAAMRGM